jgi:hypothetical protein
MMEWLARGKRISLFGLVNSRDVKKGLDKCSSLLDFFITNQEEKSWRSLQETNALVYLASLSVEMNKKDGEACQRQAR